MRVIRFHEQSAFLASIPLKVVSVPLDEARGPQSLEGSEHCGFFRYSLRAHVESLDGARDPETGEGQSVISTWSKPERKPSVFLQARIHEP